MNLITEPITVVLIALYRYQNFPIRIMHSLLEKSEGIEPHTIFFQNFYTNALKYPTAREEELFKKKIIELNPRIVGLSVYSPFVPIAKRLTKIIKNYSSALVMWGGIHPTLSPESCIKETDVICLGEGEGALTDFVSAVRDGTEYQHIDNLWINNNGHIIKNPMRPLIQDLDTIPFPAYGREPFSFIGSNELTGEDPTLLDPNLQVLPARGCPFNCSYCVNSLLRPMYKNLGRYIRRRSAVNVIDEIRQILQIPGNRKEIVEFQDENFGTDFAWLDEFESLYPKEIGLPFKVQYNPKLVKADAISRLVQIGLHRVKFGIETGTDHIRNHIFNRPGKNNEIINLAKELSDCKVKFRYDLIMDNPYDTEESLKDTIDLLLQLPKPLRFNFYSLQYFPNYPLTRKALADGHINEEEASVDSLEKRMARNWAFVPKLIPSTKKQMLQNIIWLYVYGHVKDDIVKHAVFKDSLGAKLLFLCLNITAVFLGKILRSKKLIER
ncbi:MAG: cobalamin-dependent protein [Deltaproteobacteria bacterium]|nr:MAG: cobalamin-dependent protein [Deltaproteobacteria bacterium]